MKPEAPVSSTLTMVQMNYKGYASAEGKIKNWNFLSLYAIVR